MFQTLTNNDDDPAFSVHGDLAINWGYADKPYRIVLTGEIWVTAMMMIIMHMV